MRWGRLAYLLFLIAALVAISVMDTMHGRRMSQPPHQPITNVSVP